MAFTPSHSKRVLSVFQLVMINVIAIDSLRNLPTNAGTGLHIIFYYLIGAVFFLFPCIYVTAELAGRYPKTGGSYVWAREAFGDRWGFFSIWMQWIYNVIWYPTILSFIAVNIAYLIHPAFVNNTWFLVAATVLMFSLATLVNWFGMRVSGFISTLSAILGTLLPMIGIIVLGIVWWASGKTLALGMHWNALIPNTLGSGNAAFFVVIIFSLMGIEMSAVHAEEVKNPKRDYRQALIYSSLLILITLILSSTAIALIVPPQSLSIIGGLDQAFLLFLSAFHEQWLMPIIILLIILGAFGGMSAWVIGPTKGLMVAAKEGCAPKILGKTNRYLAPGYMLIAQWVIVILLCLLFLVFKSVNTWYWFLSDLTAQLALIFYLVFFLAAIRLRIKDQLPSLSMWIIAGLGCFTCFSVMMIGFIPPKSIAIHSVILYELGMVLGIIAFCLVPFLFKSNKAL